MKLRTLSIVAGLLSVGAGVGAGGRSLLAAAGQERPSQIVTPPPEITIQDTPVGPMLADVRGFTLYVTDRDKDAGKSSCYGPCAEQWVPLRAQTDTQPFGDWSLVPREDGRPQWAYKGRPLYRYRWEGKARWAEAQLINARLVARPWRGAPWVRGGACERQGCAAAKPRWNNRPGDPEGQRLRGLQGHDAV